ncbi:hypothetical protein BJV82DRAFT_70739 [Fennellomyces sp. T-0311]|nr:hypothetical protein BJV82DRAFT_70739 [Fennellomyces sp. T-0311]
MLEPPDLPLNVRANASTESRDRLRTIEREFRKRDMDIVYEFIRNRKTMRKRMNWKKCFDEGRVNGYFENCKDHHSLK